MTKVVKLENYAVPEGFNAKTKLVPDWSSIVNQIEEDLERIEEQTWRKSEEEKKLKGGEKLGAHLKWEEIRRTYDRMVMECGGGVKESMIRSFKERLQDLVVAPVDKCTREMAIM